MSNIFSSKSVMKSRTTTILKKHTPKDTASRRSEATRQHTKSNGKTSERDAQYKPKTQNVQQTKSRYSPTFVKIDTSENAVLIVYMIEHVIAAREIKI